MRQSARFLAWSVSLVLLAACGTAPRTIELRPMANAPLQVQGEQSQVMGHEDINGILDHAAQAANDGDRAKVLALLQQARASLGTTVMSEGNSMQPLAKHLDQAIGQINQADVNLREVASILIHQLQDTAKAVHAS